MQVKLFVPAETAVLYRLFDIATAMAATPFQADRQNAANTRKILCVREAVENREEEGCVCSIPLSDLIGKLPDHPYRRLSCSGRMKTFSFKTVVHE